MTHKTAVLWDMDGTLADSEPIALEALRRSIAEAGIAPIWNLHNRVVGLAADAIYAWLVAEHGLTEPPLDWERRKHRHHFSALSGLAAFDDARALFRDLEAAGIRQAIVSNSDRLLMDAQLRHIGLARPGLITIARNDVRTGKPDPEGYLRAAWLLRADPRNCLVIEDSPSGIAAGRAAGMTTCGVPHGTLAIDADIALAQMNQVRPLVGLD